MAKKEEIINYKELTVVELSTRLREGKEKLFQLRLQNAAAPLKNPRSIHAQRRDIARLNTILRQKGVAKV